MAVSVRKVQNKRDGNDILTGKPGTVYDEKYKIQFAGGKKLF